MSEQEQPTIAARYLVVGVHIAETGNSARGPLVARVEHLTRTPGLTTVAATLVPVAGGQPWLINYQPGHLVVLATPEQIESAEAEGRRDALGVLLDRLTRDAHAMALPLGGYAELRLVVDSRADVDRWADHLKTEVRASGAVPAIEASWESGPVRLWIHVTGPADDPTGLTHSRTTEPEQAATSCPAGWGCDGRRDGSPSPYACPECGHCVEHGSGGCAARKSNDVRCGCTGGGAS